METKINWGKGLIIGMSIFMLFIISLAVAIFNQKADDYDHSYYEKGLDFDNDYKREQQVVADGAKPTIKVNAGILNLGFKGQTKGKLHFQRPSDQKMDKEMLFDTDVSGKSEVPLKQFTRGRWQLIIEWANQDKQYLYQQEIFVP
nr:FixH family protein [uncultured Mucilaginibacter sp.]